MRRLRFAALLLALSAPVFAQPGSFSSYGVGSMPGSSPPALPTPAASVPAASAPAAIPPNVPPASAADARLAEAQSEQVRLQTEVEALAEERAQSEESLRGRARALYRLRRTGMLPVAGGFDALLGHLSRVERLERAVARDVRSTRFLRQREESLRAELSLVDGRIAEARREVELAHARAAQEAAMTSAFAGAFDSRALPALPVAPLPSLASLPSGSFRVHGEPTSGFAALRGRLPMPIRGGGAMREASREDGRGLELFSPSGSPVVSVADGRVAFVGRHGSLGRTVVLDHGDGHYTLYAGLAESGLAVGEWVGQGAQLGALGADPLYFEVRRGTRSEDTRSWIGL